MSNGREEDDDIIELAVGDNIDFSENVKGELNFKDMANEPAARYSHRLFHFLLGLADQTSFKLEDAETNIYKMGLAATTLSTGKFFSTPVKKTRLKFEADGEGGEEHWHPDNSIIENIEKVLQRKLSEY